MLIVARSTGEPSQKDTLRALLTFGASLCMQPDLVMSNGKAVTDATQWVVEDLFPRLFGPDNRDEPVDEYFEDSEKVGADMAHLASLFDKVVGHEPGRGAAIAIDDCVVVLWAGKVPLDAVGQLVELGMPPEMVEKVVTDSIGVAPQA